MEPTIPDGWKRVATGDSKQQGDRLYNFSTNAWDDVKDIGGKVFSGNCVIRRIAPSAPQNGHGKKLCEGVVDSSDRKCWVELSERIPDGTRVVVFLAPEVPVCPGCGRDLGLECVPGSEGSQWQFRCREFLCEWFEVGPRFHKKAQAQAGIFEAMGDLVRPKKVKP